MDKNYSKFVDIAYNLHVSGKFKEAMDIYEKLLSFNPDDLDVKNLYAQLNVSLKNYDIALELFKDIYNKTKLDDIKINIAKIYFYQKHYKEVINLLKDFESVNKNILNLLSFSYLKERNYDLAISCYKKLIELVPNDFQCFFNISMCYKYLNNINESLKYALFGLKINSSDVDLLLHIASLYEQLKDINNEIKYLEKVIQLKKDESILYRLGTLYKKVLRFNEAVETFDKVLQINPNNKNAMLSIASTYKSIDMENAIEIYNDIQKMYPDDLTIPFCIYTIYFEMLDFKKALHIALELIKKKSDDYIYYLMAGDSYFELYDYEQSIYYYKKAEELNPENNQIKECLAKAYYSNRNLDLADNILSIINKDSKTYTFIHLKLKDLKKVINGFYKWCTNIRPNDYGKKKAISFFYKFKINKQYEINAETFVNIGEKSKLDNRSAIIAFSEKNIKLTDNINNKKILIYCMHGIGDFIMFARYLKIINSKASKLLLYIPNSLERIVKYNFPDIEIYIKGEDIKSDMYDYAMPEMLSLCFSDTDLYNIPFSSGYLTVSNKLIREKAKLRELKTDRKKVGLFWQGNPTVLINRSMKLSEFIPLFNINEIQLYSFQISKIDTESEALKNELPLIDLAPHIKDYADTAALLKNIDLLITIDSSIAHLAGAMGISTYLLLPYDFEWRWFTDEEKTPWYDSVKLFKQKKPNDWKEVIKRVKNEIQLSTNI